jgi:uncharacterized protein YvpB
MSKLGFHVSHGKHGDLGKILKRCTDEKSPVPVIFSVDQDVWPDTEQFSPQTVVIFRHKPLDPQNPKSKGLDAPLGTYHDDPVNSARGWMDMIMPIWAKNNAHFYAPINEQDAGDLAGYAWLNTFTLECLKIAEANSLKLALYAFSGGNPRDGETDLDRSTLEDKWRELLPSLQRAKANGHILLLHEYGFHLKLLRASAPNLALRYRRSYAFLRQFNADPPLVISEASANIGFDPNGDREAWLDDVQWYDSELTKDREVIGCCLYQLGGRENFADVLPRLGDYIRTHPTSGETPHVTQQASADGTTVPPNITLTDSVGRTWSLGDSDGVGRRLLRDNVQFAGGQGELLLFHNQQVFTRNSRKEWFVAATAEWQPVPGDPRPQPAINPTLTAGQPDRKILDVPYLSQLAPSADFAPGDCGPSDVAMMLRFHGMTLTVNTVSQATGQSSGFTALGIGDLVNVATRFGLTLRHEPNTSIAELRQQIDMGKPCLVLVNYPLLPHRFDPDYTRAHYLVIVGHTRDSLIYHDPFFPGDDGKAIEIRDEDFDRAWSTLPDNGDFTIPRQVLLDAAFMSSGTAGAANVDASVLPAVSRTENLSGTLSAPSSPAWRGLHMRADGHSNAADFQCITIAHLDAAKIMTNTSFDEYAHLRTLVPPERIVLRLFAAGDNASLGNGEQFFKEQRLWLNEFEKHGGRFIEIHNEPNLSLEGFGRFWQTPQDFGAWYRDVARRIRAALPTLLLGWPGLSPQDNVPEFMPALDTCIQVELVDWIGAHAYWKDAAGLESKEDARYYRRFLNKGKPVLITEFANVGNVDSDEIKGQQYRLYYNTLDSGVLAAFAFVSSASDLTFNQKRETWVRNDTVTAISHLVGG